VKEKEEEEEEEAKGCGVRRWEVGRKERKS
jgi:hypothetical protein